MKNANLLDQFFLKEQVVIEEMICALSLKKKDVILEIGAGSGVITKQLIGKARKVIAIEIDKHFKKDLKGISGNFQVIFEDALKILKNRKKYPLKFNKIIGSLPSSIVEPLMHILTEIDFKLAVFLVPLKFAYKLVDSEIFTAHFEIEILQKVSKKNFSPVPKTNWALIRVLRKPDPFKKDVERFLKQYVYKHPKAKLENALKEGLICFYQAQGKRLTKNEAREIIATKNPPFFRKKSGSGGF